MDMSAQLHAPAVGSHWVAGGWVGPRASLNVIMKIVSCPYQKSNSGPPAPSLVATLTVQLRLFGICMLLPSHLLLNICKNIVTNWHSMV